MIDRKSKWYFEVLSQMDGCRLEMFCICLKTVLVEVCILCAQCLEHYNVFCQSHACLSDFRHGTDFYTCATIVWRVLQNKTIYS